MNLRSSQSFRDQRAREPGEEHPLSPRSLSYRNALAQLVKIDAPSLQPGTLYQGWVVNKGCLYQAGHAKPLLKAGESGQRAGYQRLGGSQHIRYRRYPKYGSLEHDLRKEDRAGWPEMNWKHPLAMRILHFRGTYTRLRLIKIGSRSIKAPFTGIGGMGLTVFNENSVIQNIQNSICMPTLTIVT